MAVEVQAAVPRAPENAQSQSFGMAGQQFGQQFDQQFHQQHRQNFSQGPSGGAGNPGEAAEAGDRYRAPAAVQSALDAYF